MDFAGLSRTKRSKSHRTDPPCPAVSEANSAHPTIHDRSMLKSRILAILEAEWAEEMASTSTDGTPSRETDPDRICRAVATGGSFLIPTRPVSRSLTAQSTRVWDLCQPMSRRAPPAQVRHTSWAATTVRIHFRSEHTTPVTIPARHPYGSEYPLRSSFPDHDDEPDPPRSSRSRLVDAQPAQHGRATRSLAQIAARRRTDRPRC